MIKLKPYKELHITFKGCDEPYVLETVAEYSIGPQTLLIKFRPHINEKGNVKINFGKFLMREISKVQTKRKTSLYGRNEVMASGDSTSGARCSPQI